MNNKDDTEKCMDTMNILSNAKATFLVGSSMDENESEYDELNDENLIVEESPNGRWNKLASEISVQKLPNFDTINLAIDTDKGLECAWNEIHINKLVQKFNDFCSSNGSNNDFNGISSDILLENVHFNLKLILQYLKQLDHLNILTFCDHWYVDSEETSKWVVITELSTAGSLKKLLDNARQTKNPIKQTTYKRWLNQLLNAIRHIHMHDLSIFRGIFYCSYETFARKLCT
jgi:hypothetical protein